MVKMCKNHSIKKHFLLLLLFFSSLNLFATEKNSISCGIIAYKENYSNSSTYENFYNPCFSYERLIKSFTDYLSLSGEVNFLFVPSKNVYSFSANAKLYFGEFEGLFFGFSPLSEINFANLFTEEPYLNFGIGQMIGFRANFKRLSFESNITFSLPLYDKNSTFKTICAFSLGFLF